MIAGGVSKQRNKRAFAIATACLIGANVGATHLAKGGETVPPWIEGEATAKSAPRAIFAGQDQRDHVNLWVTDGTSAGTRELTAAAAYSRGLFYTYSQDSPEARPEFTILSGKALFAANGGTGKLGLWVTGGTAAGTKELAIAGAWRGGVFGPDGYGSLDPHFAVFGRKAVFAGFDTRTYRDPYGGIEPEVGLWVTDGTSAGTRELTAGRTAPLDQFHDPGFTALGSKALFVGSAPCGDFCARFGLWVTNGTAAGTKELQVARANSLGLFINTDEPDFTVVGSRVLFNGGDADGKYNLWMSDGTAAGTREIIVWRAYNGLTGSNFTVFGREVLFVGHDADDNFHNNLWVTDGTGAGTKQLRAAGAFSGGVFGSSTNFNFVVFKREALFTGTDAAFHRSLWVTDGTSTGTSRLRVARSNSSGLFGEGNSNFDPEFTALGGKVLFSGFDAQFRLNLWATDGTSEGTKELTVPGSDSGGLAPAGFAILGNKVLFTGIDSGRHTGLWVTNGTSPGTQQLTVRGASAEGLRPSNITPLTP